MSDINDLREALFDTIKRLKDPEDPMDTTTARAISDVAGRLIDTAKVEVQYLEVTEKGQGSGFLGAGAPSKGLPEGVPKEVAAAVAEGRRDG